MWSSVSTSRKRLDQDAYPNADDLVSGAAMTNAQQQSDTNRNQRIPYNGAADGAATSHGAHVRHFGLWPLQIDDKHNRKYLSAEQPILPDSESSLSTSSTSLQSNIAITSGTERYSATMSNSDSSPPTTPPDALSASLNQAGRQWASFSPSNISGASDVLNAQMGGDSLSKEGDEEQKTKHRRNEESLLGKINVPKVSSRNSIFTASSPVMKPAPRLPQTLDRNTTLPDSPQTPAKNGDTARARQTSFFFDSSSSSPAPSPANSLALPHSRSSLTLSLDDNNGNRPGYGRSNTKDRERERERIRETNMEVDFRLCPSKSYLLGEGRHSNVYLGSYRVQRRLTEAMSDAAASLLQDEEETHEWTLCALKRPHADHHSQLLALEEAFTLRRLGSHPNVVKLIKIRDEVELELKASNGVCVGAGSSTTRKPGRLGLGLPTDRNTSASPSNHSRSTSDTPAMEKAHQAEHTSIQSALHRRLVSQPEGTPSGSSLTKAVLAVEDEGMEGDDLSEGSFHATADKPLREGQAQNEPPRLLMLLELLPFSLSTFVRRNPEMVDYEQWRLWARELAGVVEWMHARGCIHADLKPENVLLTSDLRVKVCDFNSAVFPSPSTPLIDGMGLGTPAFGAPELSRGFQRQGTTLKGFSFPVDIWSLGAIFYSLATGVEPFRTARSMIDMVYRKRMFFEMEENERTSRISVAQGSPSTTTRAHSRSGLYPGLDGESLPASRNGSLRGRKSQMSYNAAANLGSPNLSKASNASRHQRAPSSESVSSVASMAVGRAPSAQAIALLLDENTPTGLLGPPDTSSQKIPYRYPNHINAEESASPARLTHISATINGHHRASSMGKMQGDQFRTSPHQRNGGADGLSSARKDAVQVGERQDAKYLQPPIRPVRPDSFRRTTSYTGQPSTSTPPLPPVSKSTDESQDKEQDNGKERRPSQDAADLRLAVAAAMANININHSEQDHEKGADSHRIATPLRHTYKSNNSSDTIFSSNHSAAGLTHATEQDDERAYTDGSPALILPGGGRLPDEARALLQRMLNVDPDLRPTAAQVCAALDSF